LKNIFFTLSLVVFGTTTLFSQEQEHRISFSTTLEFKSFFHSVDNFYPIVSAHRGGPTTNFPENCTATFQNTITYNPAVIETDIAMTKDSVLVMMHDNTLDRTTTGTGNISTYTYSELQDLFLKDNEGNITPYKIETLDEVLQWGKDKVVYTLDVKRGVPFKKVVDAVAKNKAQNYSIIITYNANQAAEVYALAPELLLSVSARGKEDIERMEDLGVKVENMVAFIGVTFPKPEVMTYMKSRGITCISGTMGNIDKSAEAKNNGVYLDIVNEGVMIISSDRPKQVAQQMQLYIDKHQIQSEFVK
jgi:glycerophosphoryl diester phosphodiesterase